MQSGINLKVCKRTGRAGPIVTLKCMEISMANHVMGYGAPKNHSHLAIEGIFVRRDSAGRFCLNDFQRAAGGEERHNPNRWLRSEMAAQLIAELTPDMAFAPVDVVRGGSTLGHTPARNWCMPMQCGLAPPSI